MIVSREMAGHPNRLRTNGPAVGLVNRAGRAGIHGAASFTWIDVPAGASALREGNVGEGFLIWHVVGVDSIAETGNLRAGEGLAQAVVAGSGRAAEYSSHRAQGNICNVIRDAASVGVSCVVAGQDSQPSAAGQRSRWYAGIQAQQVGDGPSGSSRRGDRRLILDQRQEIQPWRRRYIDSEHCVENPRQ